MQQLISVSDLVEMIFTHPPRDACTLNVQLVSSVNPATDRDMYNVQMFPYLMDIFINGAVILFGQTVTPQNMTDDQFELLKKYMLSLGHKVMHRYEECADGKVLVHIWFEPMINKKTSGMLIGCRGNVVFN